MLRTAFSLAMLLCMLPSSSGWSALQMVASISRSSTDAAALSTALAPLMVIAPPRAKQQATPQQASERVVERIGRFSSSAGALSAALAPLMPVTPSHTRRVPTQQQEPAGSNEMLALFVAHFQGHFDNHAQIAAETIDGLYPREGGGHEHIHCSLQPITLHDRPQGHHMLASYYFNGDPSKVFRERLYELDALPSDPQFGACVRMRIYKMRECVTERLRAGSGADDVAWSAAEDLAPSLHVPEADVFWRQCGERFEGSMRTESIEIISERSGRPIAVRDDVALWSDSLWVNDRGSDAETGAYVYGNVHGIPYKMARVPDDHWTVVPSHPDTTMGI